MDVWLRQQPRLPNGRGGPPATTCSGSPPRTCYLASHIIHAFFLVPRGHFAFSTRLQGFNQSTSNGGPIFALLNADGGVTKSHSASAIGVADTSSAIDSSESVILEI